MAILENPTPIERFVQLIPLRYPLAALVWVVILGPVSYGLSDYLQNGASPLYFPNPVNALLGGLLLFYLFIIVRYVRTSVATAEPSVTQIMVQGERAYDSIFGRVNNTRSIILLSVVLEALAFTSTLPGRSVSIISVLDVLTQVILIVAFASLIWEYSVSSWGLHKVGSSQLKLKSFLEDRFMGARTIGNMALSLTTVYLVGLVLFFLDTATFLPVLTAPFELFYLTLLAVGVVLFFLPLNSLHKKMLAEKGDRQRELSDRFLALKQSNQNNSLDGQASTQSVGKAIWELIQLKDFEITERKLASTPTWPFGIQLLAKLVTIVLSVTAVLLTRLITDYLIHI